MKLIIDMDMPRNCGCCTLKHQGEDGIWRCDANNNAVISSYSDFLSRPSSCPIKGELSDFEYNLLKSCCVKKE